jgi:hypothetical protein
MWTDRVRRDWHKGIVNLMGFAHLSGISGLRQVTGFQGLRFYGNDLKQPTSAQVDDAFASYGAAKREIMPCVEHRQHGG